uniref:AlNc14C150G7518 protein n=1 Tax=Albugo laibachii Nc14 TaxID=890382 RepID=F0WM05_9STRA|nr:AlNc14C150G7518 [Albugo laibachii Nc14]|eukprot:CCA22332.1 AlNc14C150G7518 [Albugo laibachii Nc14]
MCILTDSPESYIASTEQSRKEGPYGPNPLTCAFDTYYKLVHSTNLVWRSMPSCHHPRNNLHPAQYSLSDDTLTHSTSPYLIVMALQIALHTTPMWISSRFETLLVECFFDNEESFESIQEGMGWKGKVDRRRFR